MCIPFGLRVGNLNFETYSIGLCLLASTSPIGIILALVTLISYISKNQIKKINSNKIKNLYKSMF
jgi:hypothetical protein